MPRVSLSHGIRWPRTSFCYAIPLLNSKVLCPILPDGQGNLRFLTQSKEGPVGHTRSVGAVCRVIFCESCLDHRQTFHYAIYGGLGDKPEVITRCTLQLDKAVQPLPMPLASGLAPPTKIFAPSGKTPTPT